MRSFFLLYFGVLLSISTQAFAAQPVTLYPIQERMPFYYGHVNSISIGGSLRAKKDVIPLDLYPRMNDACLVNPTSSANLGQAMRQPGDTVNLGIPAGSTIVAAHLYWAGSWSPDTVPPTYNTGGVPATAPINYKPAPTYAVTPIPASNATVPDYQVTLNGQLVSSDINMTHAFSLTNTNMFNPAIYPTSTYLYDFFGGHAIVTNLVKATGNGLYTFGGLTVNTQGYHCFANAVLAGWALHVIYRNPAEPYRVIKLYDGFEIYHGRNVVITPTGFTVPAIPKGKVVVTTWEGDESNSGSLGLFQEDLKISLSPSTVPTIQLSGPLNPVVDAYTALPNQFNGTVNTTAPTFPLIVPNSTTSVGAPPAPWGVDIDHYDISAQLTPGQTSLTTEYSSGADLVILSSEMVVVENVPFTDLSISKTHVGDFGVGLSNHYNITVSNVGIGTGLLDEPGPIVVTDTLPAGLNYVGASGTGWTCSYAGTLSCSHPGPLVKGSSLPPITLTVTAPAIGTVTNTATVSGSLIDNLTLNNTSSDVTNIINPPILTVLKSASAASANPGANITYTVQVTNTGPGAATTVSQSDNLSKYTAFGVECIAPGVSIAYADGVPASTLIKGTPTFYKNGVAYVPPSLGSGVCTYDPNITSFILPMTGSMPPTGTYSLQYKTQVK